MTIPNILTVGNTSAAGRPCRILNALGNDCGDVVIANLITGDIERFKRDKSGELVIDFEAGEVVRERLTVAAPLRVVWL